MMHRFKTLGFSYLMLLGFVMGCLEEFPAYQPPASNDVAVMIQDVSVRVDQGEICSTSDGAELGMPCLLSGGAACGVWACVDATLDCAPAPENGELMVPPAELCNQRDDNCDGVTDAEEFNLGTPCNMESLVEGRTARGTLICNPTQTISNAGDVSPTVCHCCLPDDTECIGSPCDFAEVCTPTEERCNGEDDDCDGNADEELDKPCEYQLDACSLQGMSRCISGVQSACMPPIVLPANCRCLQPAYAGSSHYLHCPAEYNWFDSQAVCQGILSGTTGDLATFHIGTVVEIESEIEQQSVVSQLYQQGDRAAKTWLNHRYDPTTDPDDFEDWLAQYFPTGRYHRISDNDFDDDEERCLTLEEFPNYDWNFDPCADDFNTLTCEFCADPPPDLDADGYSSCGGDCDDGDQFVNPGFDEVCYNGKDDNCDGVVDEDCSCETRIFNGHRYVFCFDEGETEHLSWWDARTRCRDWNMDLLVLNDLAEFNRMTRLARELANRDLFWVGVRQPTAGPNNEGDVADRARPWIWVQTGEVDEANFVWWQDGDRARHDREERDCGRLFSESETRRHLRPDECNKPLAFICESI